MRGNLLAASALVAAAAAAPVSAADLVTNGGFETGNLNGWTLTGNTGFTGVTTDSHSGKYAGSFGQVGSTGSLSQTLSTVAGQTYVFSFWLKNNGGPANSFDALWGGVDEFSLTNSPAFGYSFESFTVMATGSSTQLSFDFRQDPSFWYIDDISVQPAGVPEPATWAMMFLGLGAVGFALRRARPHSQAMA